MNKIINIIKFIKLWLLYVLYIITLQRIGLRLKNNNLGYDISPEAVRNLVIGMKYITFTASFDSCPRDVVIELKHVDTIEVIDNE